MASDGRSLIRANVRSALRHSAFSLCWLFGFRLREFGEGLAPPLLSSRLEVSSSSSALSCSLGSEIDKASNELMDAIGTLGLGIGRE